MNLSKLYNDLDRRIQEGILINYVIWASFLVKPIFMLDLLKKIVMGCISIPIGLHYLTCLHSSKITTN